MTTDEMVNELQNYFVKGKDMKSENKIEFRHEMGLTNDEQRLLELADDMAAAMSNLNSQNYKEFIDARDRFRSMISEMCKKTKENEIRIAHMKAAILAA